VPKNPPDHSLERKPGERCELLHTSNHHFFDGNNKGPLGISPLPFYLRVSSFGIWSGCLVSTRLPYRHARGFLLPSPPAVCERGHCGLACRGCACAATFAKSWRRNKRLTYPGSEVLPDRHKPVMTAEQRNVEQARVRFRRDAGGSTRQRHSHYNSKHHRCD
jgi:hypothetical protein